MYMPPAEFPPAPALERFTRTEVLRMAGVTARQMARWERLRLVEPRPPAARCGERLYSFQDLVGLRTIKQATGQGVPATRLRAAIDAMGTRGRRVSLASLRVAAPGLAVEYEGQTIEPLSGQLVFRFEPGESNLRVMKERTVEDWLAIAAQAEGDLERRPQAIEAYLHVVEAAPHLIEAHINLGTLFYESGELEEARERFQIAVTMGPQNALAHFNLGSVLDELHEFDGAVDHLKEAVRLKTDYADAHYNLARVYEELGGLVEARPHWLRYLELDPDSSWAEYARQRLAAGGI
ncbi:MAG TPA: tetratricopeptide repeat protein [Terriglobia bacterium]|nr:tetratricopeptide repeat protein [Terriglobia bacterium]